MELIVASCVCVVVSNKVRTGQQLYKNYVSERLECVDRYAVAMIKESGGLLTVSLYLSRIDITLQGKPETHMMSI